jgi:hypothetical protein
MKIVYLLAIYFCVIFSTVLGGTILPNVDDKKYLEYGDKFPHVIKISGHLKSAEDPDIIASGSGIIINEHWVITAAHVIDCSENHFFYLNDKKYTIDKLIIHSSFDLTQPLTIADIALCRVSEKVELEHFPQLYEDTDEVNQSCDIAGYGYTGTGISGESKFDSLKRAGTNIVDNANEDVIFCDMTNKSPTKLEILISHGDSGGGLFINNKLAGINSFVFSTDGKPDSSFGDGSAHTRISTYIDWIKENITNHSKDKK